MNNSQFDIRVNDFAVRAFRNGADRDYIAGRLCMRAGLVPQSLWAALQAFEKYFKCILLLNRISSKGVGHDITKALELVRAQVPGVNDLRPDSFDVFLQVATQGADRYLIDSYAVHGHLLPQLDAAVWDVRRYCQARLFTAGYRDNEPRVFELTLEHLSRSRSMPSKFKIAGGLLEEIVANPRHPARSGLCWQNAFFGRRSRPTVRSHFYLHAENAPLLLYPEMIDYLSELIHVPSESRRGYQQYLSDLESGAATRF